ncbi:hypothetical protein MasN3_09590 [Massilia varians]|uniref:Uncharacterized protein n=1 Tax=Massilia varians TaxID=457921 RepID=A0ABM8C2U8_9BURK|nr:hypothetical protein MasN3_09590 [Massilia varians]
MVGVMSGTGAGGVGGTGAGCSGTYTGPTGGGMRTGSAGLGGCCGCGGVVEQALNKATRASEAVTLRRVDDIRT